MLGGRFRGHWRQTAMALIAVVLSTLFLNNLRVGAQGSNPAPGLPAAAAASPDGAQFAWWQGQDGNLWETWYDPGSGTWKGPSNLGDGPLGSAPGATTTTGQQDVFWRGTDNNLWETWYAGNWNGPANLGYGNLASAPGVASVYSTGAEFVFWKGSNGDLWEAWYSGSWYGPADLGMGPLGSAPTVAVDSSGNQYVFWQGTDSILREAWYTGSWHGPVIPVNTGAMGSAPSATFTASTQEVFWAGTDGNLWEAWYTGVWNGPAKEVATGTNSMGTAPSVAAVNSQTDAFWWGEGALWEAWYSGGWNGPQGVFFDKCNPGRNSDSTTYWDGWGRNASIELGGVESYVLNYSPWVWPQWINNKYNAGSGWVMLATSSTPPWYEQVGWWEQAYGVRQTFIQFTNPNNPSGDPITISGGPVYPIDTYTWYSVWNNNYLGQSNPNYVTFAVGSCPGSSCTMTPEAKFFQPYSSEISGEIKTLSDQMPGDTTNSFEYFLNSQLYLANGWADYSGTTFKGDQNGNGGNNFSSAVLSSTAIATWDLKC